MAFDDLYHFSFAEYADFTAQSPTAWEHCKTLPWYIFAQAYEGHYELDAGDRSAVCEEGGAFFTPPGVPLRIRHYLNPETGRMRVRFIHFLPSDRYGLDPLRGFMPHLSVSAAECRRPGRILAGIISGRDGIFHRNSRIMALVAILSGFMEPIPQKPVAPELESVCVWIRQHAGEAITACDAAGQYPYSRSKFFADFTRAYGVAPGEYIMRERIRFAAAMMRAHPDVPLKEIAWRGGWETPYHFSRCFRSVTGEPPGRYRGASQTF